MSLSQSKSAVVIACLVIVGSIAGLWFELRTSAPKIDRTPIIGVNSGIGEVMADETVKSVHDKGNIVLLNNNLPEGAAQSADDCWTTFRQELQKHSAIHIMATEIIPPDPSDGPHPGCSSKQFMTLMEKHPQADAFIFFIALPDWSRVDPLLTKPISAKLIAVDANRLSLRRDHYTGYFNSGILTALVGLRNGAETKPAVPPQTPREWFNKYYQVYTPENYEALFAADEASQPDASGAPHP